MNIVSTIIASILIGLIPEVTYFFLFLIYVKEIKEKRIKLWLLIALVYILCMFIQRYKIFYYILFIAFIYLILKLLYKKKVQVIDIFVFSISTIYLSILAMGIYPLAQNNYSIYYLLLILNRILLFLPFIFKAKIRELYIKYHNLWNRNFEKKNPIKSITLRNISLIVINIFIFILNIATVSCLYLFQ